MVGFGAMSIQHPNTEFFRSIIDYAGLFPPAALPLNEALAKYSRYLRGDDKEYLSHFVIPVAKFDEVSSELQSLFTQELPLSLSVLSSALHKDFATILEFLSRGDGAFVLGAIEAKFNPQGDLASQLKECAEVYPQLPADCTTFYEIPACSGWEERLGEAVSALCSARNDLRANVGFKLRCGGLSAEMIPSVDQVATALLKCADAKIPVKFTAGLHHPFRHKNTALDCMFHGYMNLFFAGMVVAAGERSFTTITEFIDETDSSNLMLSNEKLSWKGQELTAEKIRVARKESVISFGSCSFEEPIDDAKNHGWL
jgi:hypothetical protein